MSSAMSRYYNEYIKMTQLKVVLLILLQILKISVEIILEVIIENNFSKTSQKILRVITVGRVPL